VINGEKDYTLRNACLLAYMQETKSVRVRIGNFELHLKSGELRSGERKIVLQEQPLQVLRILISADGEIVTRDEIQKTLWPHDTIVEFDHSINTAIKKLRRALGDSPETPKYIETIARRGYRLMVPVEPVESSDDRVDTPTPAEPPQPVQQELPTPPTPATPSDPLPGAQAAAAEPARTPDPVEVSDTQTLFPHSDPNAPIFSTGELICDRYLVVRFIAMGGMGQVYEVDDLELKSPVALKTIAPARASSPRQVERFRREIQLARKVSHPNVCRVFDLGRHIDDKHGEVLFLTMELVPGETLSTRLREKGAFSREEALPLIRQMVSALSAAHQLGIVHRDFKPGNVILLPQTSGTNLPRGGGTLLKITDFGLAIDPELHESFSGTHPEVVGTPDYMPPEQFRGQCSTRTDVYSLGVTVFQMLTGSLPTSFQTPFKALGSGSGSGKALAVPGKAKSTDSGSKAKSTDSGTHRRIPQRWREAITRAMSLNPEDRFASVEEFWSALSGERLGFRGIRLRLVLYAAAACLVLALVALLATGVIRNPFRRPKERHLAVLPFLNIGNDPTDKAFAEGVSETLTSRLSQLERFQKSFWVVPAGDARTVKSPEEAHRDLDVNLAVTGSVERTQDGVEVTTNLIDTAKHRQLASRTLNVPSISLEDLQQQVWEAVADMLDLQVPPEVKAELAAGGTSHPEAYRLYAQGMGYLGQNNPGDLDRVIDLFNKALAIDPNYALAYAVLGEAYAAKYSATKDPQWITKATSNAGRAVELNDKLIPVRMSLARVYGRTGQYDKAIEEYKRVLEQDPTVTDAEYDEAQVYEAQGHFRQAEDLFRQAITRHPSHRAGHVQLGNLYYSTGRFTEAVQQFQAAVDLAPDEPNGYYNLGAAYIALGRYDEAIAVLKKGLGIKPTPEAWTNLGGAYMYLGKWEEAADAMKRATDLSPHDDVMWRNLGDAYDQIPSRLADARQAYQKALELATEQLKVNPKDPDLLSGIALYDAHLGHKAEAEAFITRALAVAPNNSNSLFTAALVYELTGQRDKALKAVDDAVKAGYSVEEIDKEPELRALHNDPRYKAWLHQHGSASSIAKN